MNCGLCLGCGGPFQVPRKDDWAYAQVGALSINAISRAWSMSDLRLTCKSTQFCDVPEESHIFHESKHQFPLFFIAKKNDSVVMNKTFAEGKTFPFMGKKDDFYCAQWGKIPAKSMPKFTRLKKFLHAIDISKIKKIDANQTVLCCKQCNTTHTMSFWFHELLWRKGAYCLVDRDVVDFFGVATHPGGLNGYAKWTMGPQLHTIPKDVDILPAMLAYYVQGASRGIVGPLRETMVYLSWMVLEVLCLQCEYLCGYENNKAGGHNVKHSKPTKSVLGAIEMYISYFAWVLLRMKHSNIARIPFEVWHTFYGSECGRFRHKKNLMADFVLLSGPADSQVYRSLDILQSKMMNLVELEFDNIAKFLDDAGSAPLEYGSYFLAYGDIPKLQKLSLKGVVGNFDSYLARFGIDAMFHRVLELSRDIPDDLMRLMLAFVAAMRKKEVDNVVENGWVPLSIPAIYAYRMAKLLDPPSQSFGALTTREELVTICKGKQCSPWTAVMTLRKMGAFCVGDPDLVPEEIYR